MLTPTPTPVVKPSVVDPAATSLKITDENADLLQHLGEYQNLEVLSMSCLEDLQVLPDSIGQLTKLKELNIDNGNGCAMNPALPETFGNLQSLEKLVLFGAQDPRMPDDGFKPAEHRRFPKTMSNLKNLRLLDLGRNGYATLPSFVGDLPNLTTLGLAFNDLHDLPDFLNKLPKLKRISLSENRAITHNAAKKKALQRRFPGIKFDFSDEYD